jgi:flagellar hook assembly protein FlgD
VARVCLIALLALFVAPSAAQAGGVTIVSRDLPVGGERTLASTRAPIRFDLVGLHWRGTGTVLFRTRSLAGRWSGWQAAGDDNRPDGGTGEGVATRGWRLGSPIWTGPSDRLQYRPRGQVSRLRAYYLWSPVEHQSLRRLSVAGSPPIVSRASWGANALLRRNHPRYAPGARLVIVHHTATPNNYTPDEAAAIVRGIDVYHVKANGWDDIGYNFLVDRYGQVYEGRYGGMTRNVVGAHALGFNTGSVGIALIGNFMTAKPTPAAVQSLERLIAWRLDLAHVDPVSTLTFVSGGSERWRAGTRVKLRAVAGHRDTGSTSCPGNYLYPLLGQIALAAEQTGLPKLYAPVVRGRIGGPVTFSARLSDALPWTITIAGPDGRVVARGAGTGPVVAWTWNSAGYSPGRYTWRMDGGPSVLPAGGVIGSSSVPPRPSALVQGLTVTPSVVSPNGDGYADQGTVSYTLTARSTVTASVTDAAGAAVETLFTGQKQSARAISFAWSPGDVPDGHYNLVLAVQSDDGRSASATAAFTIDRTLSSVTAMPAVISPNGDGIDDTLTAAFALNGPGQVSVTVLAPDGSTVATLFSGALGSGTYSYSWDGHMPDGSTAPDGHYQVLVSVTDALGTVTQAAAFDVTSTPP